MGAPSSLAIAVIASAFFAAAALVWLVLRTFTFSPADAGNAWKGVSYAFGKGMLPWEKESAGRHRLTLAAGTVYHGGVFLALVQLCLFVLGLQFPWIVTSFLRVLLPVSLAAGVGLLVKRAVSPTLRALSCPDDYAANLVVDLFLLCSFLAALDAGWANWVLAAATVLFVYVPLGKIRHCVFFFYTRILFGLFFGKRGVLPHPAEGERP